MKRKSLFILLFLSAFTFIHAQITDYSIFDKKFNFYIANDLAATATMTKSQSQN